jgi:hypothetical protein
MAARQQRSGEEWDSVGSWRRKDDGAGSCRVKDGGVVGREGRGGEEPAAWAGVVESWCSAAGVGRTR